MLSVHNENAVCVRARACACVHLGGLYKEALGISDCIMSMIGCSVNDELERIWKEVVVA